MANTESGINPCTKPLKINTMNQHKRLVLLFTAWSLLDDASAICPRDGERPHAPSGRL
jgi:hypothetical protein